MLAAKLPRRRPRRPRAHRRAGGSGESRRAKPSCRRRSLCAALFSSGETRRKPHRTCEGATGTTFAAYGQLLALHGSDGVAVAVTAALTSLGYSGEHFDAKMQQQYLRARWYDPDNARFNRLDPFAGNMQDPQSLHKYAYVHGDPVQGIDPTGMFSLGGSLSSISMSSQMRSSNASAVFSAAARGLLRLGWSFVVARAVLEIESLNQKVVPLPGPKVRADHDYALLAQAGYENADLAAVQQRGWRRVDTIQNFESGFHARLFEGNGERILSYAGTSTASDWLNNFQQGLFGDAPQYQQAIEEVPMLEARYGRIDRFVVHSLGGGLASAAAIVHNRRATTFNAAGVNPHFVTQFGANLAGADRLIDAYRVRGEILSTLQDSSFGWTRTGLLGARAVGIVGSVAPDSVGRTFWVEGSSFSTIERHLMHEVLAGMQKMI